MQEFCGPQIVPPTQKAAKYVLIIKVVMVFQFIIAVLDIVAANSFLREGVFGLFFLILLCRAFYKLSYQAIMIYAFISIFFAVIFLVYILTIVQQGKQDTALDSAWEQYYMAVACASLLFYLITSVFCFYPYREFKSIQFMQTPFFNEIMNLNSDVQRNPEDMPKKTESIQYAIDYGNNQPQKQKKAKGTFQVFKGQGVRIG